MGWGCEQFTFRYRAGYPSSFANISLPRFLQLTRRFCYFPAHTYPIHTQACNPLRHSCVSPVCVLRFSPQLTSCLLRVVTSRCATVDLRFVKGLKKLDTYWGIASNESGAVWVQTSDTGPCITKVAIIEIAGTKKISRTPYSGSTKVPTIPV
jgi:hypothetical protein